MWRFNHVEKKPNKKDAEDEHQARSCVVTSVGALCCNPCRDCWNFNFGWIRRRRRSSGLGWTSPPTLPQKGSTVDLQPADPTRQMVGREAEFSISQQQQQQRLFVNRLPSTQPGRQRQAAINYKEILSSCGEVLQQHQYPKQTDTAQLGSSLPCTAATGPRNPGAQDPITADQSERREESEGREACYLAAAAS